MIRDYVHQALRRAHYDKCEDGTYYGEVSELQGVLAAADSLEDSRARLSEIVEEGVLVRVARGLSVPPLGDVEVKVDRTD